MSDKPKIITVQDFIDILSKIEDPDLTNIEIYFDGDNETTYVYRSWRKEDRENKKGMY